MEMEGCQGVGLYVKHGIPYKPEPDIGNRLMATTVEVNRPKQKLLLITVLYRHPRSRVDFFQKFEDLLIIIYKTNNESIITGDFNCDYSHVKNVGSLASSAQSIASVFNFEQHVKELTP